MLVPGSIACTHSTWCNIKNKPHVIYITSKIQYYNIAYLHSSRLTYKYNTAEQQIKSFVASINSTGTVEYNTVTLQRNTYSSHTILQHRMLQPENGSVHWNVRQVTRKRIYNRPTSTCRISQRKAYGLFCRKPVFPSHTTTSQILIFLANPKYGWIGLHQFQPSHY